MDTPPDLTGFAHALGRAQAAWRFAGTELRRAAALATISAAWDIFRRDAGAGEVGPAHETTAAAAQLLFTEDPRRDAVLLWLADEAVPAIAEAAAIVARMVGATRRFGTEDQALLDAARDAIVSPVAAVGPIGRLVPGDGRSGNAVMQSFRELAAVVDRLRGDASFLETAIGTEVRHALPRGTLNRCVSPEPSACWALNLVLLGINGQTAGVPLPPGLVSRMLFRNDLEPGDVAAALVDCAETGWSGIYNRLLRLQPELARSRDALAHLSRNARTPDAWLLVAALGACTRTQLARALSLSRAGADIQARALADAGLVTLAAGGQIVWTRVGVGKDAAPAPLARGPLSDAMSDIDASLAEIDRLLAHTAR